MSLAIIFITVYIFCKQPLADSIISSSQWNASPSPTSPLATRTSFRTRSRIPVGPQPTDKPSKFITWEHGPMVAQPNPTCPPERPECPYIPAVNLKAPDEIKPVTLPLEGEEYEIAFNETCVLWDNSCKGNKEEAKSMWRTNLRWKWGVRDTAVHGTCIRLGICEGKERSKYGKLVDWMRSPACDAYPYSFQDEDSFLNGEGPEKGTCCGHCRVDAETHVDIYYWQDPLADTSCLEVIGDEVYPIDYGATVSKESGLREQKYWGCKTKGPDGNVTTVPTAYLAEDIPFPGFTSKEYLVHPLSSQPCPEATLTRAPRHSVQTSILRPSLRVSAHSLSIPASARWQNGTEVTTKVEGNWTFTSPSVYAHFYTLAARDECGLKEFTSMMLTMLPEELTSIAYKVTTTSLTVIKGTTRTSYGMSTMSKPFNLRDFPCPPRSVQEEMWWKPAPGDPYRPWIAAPKQLQSLNPFLERCSLAFSAFDPPKALVAEPTLAPQPMAMQPDKDGKIPAPAKMPAPDLPNPTPQPKKKEEALMPGKDHAQKSDPSAVGGGNDPKDDASSPSKNHESDPKEDPKPDSSDPQRDSANNDPAYADPAKADPKDPAKAQPDSKGNHEHDQNGGYDAQDPTRGKEASHSANDGNEKITHHENGVTHDVGKAGSSDSSQSDGHANDSAGDTDGNARSHGADSNKDQEEPSGAQQQYKPASNDETPDSGRTQNDPSDGEQSDDGQKHSSAHPKQQQKPAGNGNGVPDVSEVHDQPSDEKVDYSQVSPNQMAQLHDALQPGSRPSDQSPTSGGQQSPTRPKEGGGESPAGPGQGAPGSHQQAKSQEQSHGSSSSDHTQVENNDAPASQSDSGYTLGQAVHDALSPNHNHNTSPHNPAPDQHAPAKQADQPFEPADTASPPSPPSSDSENRPEAAAPAPAPPAKPFITTIASQPIKAYPTAVILPHTTLTPGSPDIQVGDTKVGIGKQGGVVVGGETVVPAPSPNPTKPKGDEQSQGTGSGKDADGAKGGHEEGKGDHAGDGDNDAKAGEEAVTAGAPIESAPAATGKDTSSISETTKSSTSTAPTPPPPPSSTTSPSEPPPSSTTAPSSTTSGFKFAGTASLMRMSRSMIWGAIVLFLWSVM